MPFFYAKHHHSKYRLNYEEIQSPGYENVVRVRCESVGLDALIVIHSTVLGPALGGVRIHNYSSFENALEDGLRLAKGMTYKAAFAHLGWGGGKSIIFADPKAVTPDMLMAFGHAVKEFQGRYICAEDLGSSPKEMRIIHITNPYIVGLKSKGSSGDPSPITAHGLIWSMRAVAQKLYKSDSLKGLTVAVQGVGHVGAFLVEFLHAEGAHVILTDIDETLALKVAKRFDAMICSPVEIYSIPCDFFAPCALGGILNSVTIKKLSCKAVVGGANNQLLTPEDAALLEERGILYAPDFVINSGGLIHVTSELSREGYKKREVMKHISSIYEELLAVFALAKEKKCTSNEAALHRTDFLIKQRTGRLERPLYFHHSDLKLTFSNHVYGDPDDHTTNFLFIEKKKKRKDGTFDHGMILHENNMQISKKEALLSLLNFPGTKKMSLIKSEDIPK